MRPLIYSGTKSGRSACITMLSKPIVIKTKLIAFSLSVLEIELPTFFLKGILR